MEKYLIALINTSIFYKKNHKNLTSLFQQQQQQKIMSFFFQKD